MAQTKFARLDGEMVLPRRITLLPQQRAPSRVPGAQPEDGATHNSGGERREKSGARQKSQ